MYFIRSRRAGFPHSYLSFSYQTIVREQDIAHSLPPAANCSALPVMNLPNEVWMEIFSYFQFRLDPEGMSKYPRRSVSSFTLAKISRVCKRFNVLAVPLLYHTVVISSNPSVRIPLVRTLIECPHLAEMVQEADIWAKGVPRTDMSDLMGYVEAALETCSGHVTSFFKYLLDRYNQRNFDRAEQTALFLYMLPNLRVAGLDVHISCQSMLKMLAAWPNLLLPHIEGLRLSNFGVDPQENTPGFDYLIQLPSLRTLHGTEFCWKEYRGPALGLRHLVFHTAFFPKGGFENMLSHCVHLETLQIYDKELSWFDLHLMGDALRHLGRSSDANAFGWWIGRMGSLRTLCRLKHLTIPWVMLVGIPGGDSSDSPGEGRTSVLPQGISGPFDLLPESLERLHLHAYKVDVDDGDLLKPFQSGRFPDLCSIHITRKKQCRTRNSVTTTTSTTSYSLKTPSRLGWAVHNHEESGSIWHLQRD